MSQFRGSADGNPRTGRARNALMRRLIDVVALPASRLPPQDRSMAGDILLEMLFTGEEEDLVLCARRLSDKTDAPRRLLRFLACAPLPVSRHILEFNQGLDDSDLCRVIATGGIEHRLLVARRKPVTSLVAENLVSFAEPRVMKVLLQNRHSNLSDAAVDGLVSASRDNLELCAILMDRRELTPAHAMAMFWWADGDTRRAILQRQAADRLELITSCADVFPIAAKEGWADPVARKGLQLIERRQRNRAAIARSPYESLENAIETAAAGGLTPQMAQEIGYLSGIKPVTIAKILSDQGGEGIAVLCKSTGLKLASLKALWRALRRPVETADGDEDPRFGHVLYTYQILTVAKAQTVLRYWNWSLSSAFSPSGPGALPGGHQAGGEEFSAPSRTAELVFGR